MCRRKRNNDVETSGPKLIFSFPILRAQVLLPFNKHAASVLNPKPENINTKP